MSRAQGATSRERHAEEIPETSRLSHLPVHLQRLGYWTDESIRLPGGFRIGWDPIIGLIPGIGDLIGTTVSTYVVFAAARAGAGKTILMHMLVNLGLELGIGSVPIIGDIFDGWFKANVRNLRLLNDHLAAPQATRRRSLLWMIFALLAVFTLAAALALLAIWLIVRTWQAVAHTIAS